MELQLLTTSFNLDESQNLMNLVKGMGNIGPDDEEIEVDISKMVYLNNYIEERSR